MHSHTPQHRRVLAGLSALLAASTVVAQQGSVSASPQQPSSQQPGPQQTGPEQPGPQQPQPFDPNRNMAADGTSVIKPEYPDDIPNPDRWRYTPGGRIKPGSIVDRLFVTTFATPIIFREEDIGFGGGIALTDIDFRNQNFREFANVAASYSEEGQQAFRFNWRRWINHRPLPEGGVIRDERSTFGVFGGYSRTLTRRFFGLGGRTPEEAETSYTEEFGQLGFGLNSSIPEAGDDLLLGFNVRYERHGLSRGEVSNKPSTDDVFPSVFRDGDGVNQFWVGAGIAYDTRDSIANPYEGWRVGLSVDAVPVQTGLDAGAIFTLDTATAFRVPPLFHDGGNPEDQHPPTDVIALGGFVRSTTGDVPFYNLPRLGGDDTLRGFIQRRFADRTAAHGSLEYRFAVLSRGVRFTDTIRLERISLAAFYDFGTVVDDLDDIGAGEYLDSYGIGIRLGLQRDAIFRIDYAISEEDNLLTISFGNPF